MQAAKAAGIPHRILVGTDGKAVPETVPEATDTARSLTEAAALILG